MEVAIPRSKAGISSKYAKVLDKIENELELQSRVAKQAFQALNASFVKFATISKSSLQSRVAKQAFQDQAGSPCVPWVIL